MSPPLPTLHSPGFWPRGACLAAGNGEDKFSTSTLSKGSSQTHAHAPRRLSVLQRTMEIAIHFSVSTSSPKAASTTHQVCARAAGACVRDFFFNSPPDRGWKMQFLLGLPPTTKVSLVVLLLRSLVPVGNVFKAANRVFVLVNTRNRIVMHWKGSRTPVDRGAPSFKRNPKP